MADDEQRYGLKVSDQQSREKPPGRAAKDTPPKPTVPHLRFISSDNDMLNGHDLLDQMMAELHKVVASSDEVDSTAAEYAAYMCMEMVRAFQAQASNEELEPMSNGHYLLSIGYLYGKLTMPDSRDYSELYRHFETNKRRVAPLKEKEVQVEQCKEWMQNKALELVADDHEKVFRIGEIVEWVKGFAEQEKTRNPSATKYWSTKDDYVKKTISPVLPEYTKRPGRPKKNEH